MNNKEWAKAIEMLKQFGDSKEETARFPLLWIINHFLNSRTFSAVFPQPAYLLLDCGLSYQPWLVTETRLPLIEVDE